MIRRPPRSTLFPYTRSSDLTTRCTRKPPVAAMLTSLPTARSAVRLARTRPSARRALIPRSEEHTSELQSRRDLVCRLLLEKKNARDTAHHRTVHEVLTAEQR